MAHLDQTSAASMDHRAWLKSVPSTALAGCIVIVPPGPENECSGLHYCCPDCGGLYSGEQLQLQSGHHPMIWASALSSAIVVGERTTPGMGTVGDNTDANETAAALMTLRKSDGEGKQDDAAAAVVAHNNDDGSTKPAMIFTPSSQASRTTPLGRDGRGGVNGFVLFLRYARYCNDGGTLTLKEYVALLLTAAGKQGNAKSKKAKATTSTAGAGAYKQSFQLWKDLTPEQRNTYNLLASQIKMKGRSSV